MRASRAIPLSVRRALSKLGQDLSVARRRRRIPMSIMAERAFISSRTLSRVERGDPRVALGIYATILFVLGMTDRLAELADPKADRLGLALDEERLPKRVRIPRRSPVK
jgi:transcriptional regulator with XRE-family HTH domain